jgi:hypothetical protein
VRDGAPDDALTVTTSRFFGGLIAARLGLAADALRATAEKSEFDYFVSYLKGTPDLSGQPPAGWTNRTEPLP